PGSKWPGSMWRGSTPRGSRVRVPAWVARYTSDRRPRIEPRVSTEPRRECPRPLLEQLAVGEHALGAGAQCPTAQLVVVVLADGEDADAGRAGRLDRGD